MPKTILYCTSHMTKISAEKKIKEIRQKIASNDPEYAEFERAYLCDKLVEPNHIGVEIPYNRIRLVFKKVKPETVETIETNETPEPAETVEQEAAVPIVIKEKRFTYKASDVHEILEDTSPAVERYAVTSTIELSMPDFYELTGNLLIDRDYLEGTGGTQSEYEIPDEYEGVELYALHPVIRRQWLEHSYRSCVRVTCPAMNFNLLVDSQGHKYARYAAIEWQEEM